MAVFSRVISVYLGCAALSSCTYSREAAPLSCGAVQHRIPNQQRLLALPVERAVDRLNWMWASPPTYHIYKLSGRVRLSVQLVPAARPPAKAYATVGEGESSLVIDETANEGYTAHLPPPE